MTGKTHKTGGMLCSLIGFALLHENGLLNPDVNEAVQLLIMYPFCMWGSIAPDLDHHWDSCPSKSYPDFVVNKALHITKPLVDLCEKVGTSKKNVFYKLFRGLNAKHRSWQTHSDLTLGLSLFGLFSLLTIENPTINTTILSLVVTGLLIGITAHFILDLITPEGIKLFLICLINGVFGTKIPDSLHLVPNVSFFATGGKWESLICKLLQIATIVGLLWVVYLILIPYLPFQITFS